MTVYFIQAGDGGPIKIGRAFNPYRRLRAMQTDNAAELSLIGQMFGDCAEERLVHDKFELLRIRGEWFEPAQELLDFIEELPPFYEISSPGQPVLSVRFGAEQMYKIEQAISPGESKSAAIQRLANLGMKVTRP